MWFTLEFMLQTEWEDKLKPQSFPLDVLRRKGEDLPEEVDPTKKEVRSAVKNKITSSREIVYFFFILAHVRRHKM